MAGLVNPIYFPLQPQAWQVDEVLHIIMEQLNNHDVRQQYANDVAAYLNAQNHLFEERGWAANQDRRIAFGDVLRPYLHALVAVRRNDNAENVAAANRARLRLRTFFNRNPDARITADQFIGLIQDLPGFTESDEDLRRAANVELRVVLRHREATYTLAGAGIISPRILRHILQILMTGAACAMP